MNFSVLNNEVRCVKFSPFYSHYFSSGYETGMIEIWDIRNSAQSMRRINGAHNGLIHAIDWHPVNKNILASGGRDLSLRIWDLSQKNDVPLKSIQTFATVSSIAWRPNYANELASSSSVIDNSAYIWDLKMPFIPKYTIETHKDVITDLIWFNNDSQFLLTCSKDYFLSLHDMNNAKKPQLNVRKACTSWNPFNHLAFASIVESKVSPTHFIDQNINIAELKKQDSELENLKFFSQNYLIFGNESIQQKCLHNASVSSKVNQFDLNSVWLTLSTLNLKDQIVEKVEKKEEFPLKNVDPQSPIGDIESPNSPETSTNTKFTLDFPPKFELEEETQSLQFEENLILNLLEHYSENVRSIHY
jgi:WD repeat-containing protein 24